ncbi:MAG: hypothetical protein AABY26_06550 [Nanoarchaeota archaeon]|mgnify:CR=1 FL=1
MVKDDFDNACKYLSHESEPCEMHFSFGLGGIEGVISQILTDKYILRVCADENVACKRCAHYRLKEKYNSTPSEKSL